MILIGLALALLIYLPALKGPPIWDDLHTIAANVYISRGKLKKPFS